MIWTRLLAVPGYILLLARLMRSQLGIPKAVHQKCASHCRTPARDHHAAGRACPRAVQAQTQPTDADKLYRARALRGCMERLSVGACKGRTQRARGAGPGRTEAGCLHAHDRQRAARALLKAARGFRCRVRASGPAAALWGLHDVLCCEVSERRVVGAESQLVPAPWWRRALVALTRSERSECTRAVRGSGGRRACRAPGGSRGEAPG